MTNVGLLDGIDDPVDVTIEKQNKKGGASAAKIKIDDEEEEDDFPSLSLELKLERAEEVKAELERERLLALKKARGFIAKSALRGNRELSVMQIHENFLANYSGLRTALERK